MSNTLVRLSDNTVVDLHPRMTWGMQEAISDAMLGGMKLSGVSEKDKQNFEMDATALTKSKYKALELIIAKITLDGGTEVAYSKEWMNALSVDDGNLLYEAVEAITNAKKK